MNIWKEMRLSKMHSNLSVREIVVNRSLIDAIIVNNCWRQLVSKLDCLLQTLTH